MTGQHSDANFQVIRSLGLQFLDGDVPEFVKNADVHRDKPEASAPQSVFADPSRRQFPLHTKSATYLSALYIAGGLANGQAWDSPVALDIVQQRIEKAATAYGILPEVQRMRQLVQEKSASAERTLSDSDFALVVDYDGTKIRRFPTVSGAAIVKSAQKLQQDRDLFPLAWRRQAAISLLKSGSALRCDLPIELADFLAKTAGMFPKSPEESAVAVRERACLFVNPEDRERMVKLSQLVLRERESSFNHVCEILDDLDQQTKTAELYVKGVPTPEDMFFNGFGIKEAGAEAPLTVELTTGTVYQLERIKEAGLEALTSIGGAAAELVSDGTLDMLKAADVLPTLPRDEAQLLDSALSACGVQPHQEEKSAEFEQLMKFTVGPSGDMELAGYRMTYKAGSVMPKTPCMSVTPPIGQTAPVTVSSKMTKPKPMSVPNDEKTEVSSEKPAKADDKA